jgi:formate--tetrahydrofolate ligase
VGLGERVDGVPRQSGFDITAASEVGVALALCSGLHDLRARLGRLVVGFTASGEPVTAEDLRAAGAMTVMLKEAVKPNLLQTLEGTPVLVHAGPFGNIATGNSSVVADLVGARMGDYLITEAGFGSDMGAERFFNIKTRLSGLDPSVAVLVASVRTLKAHSGRFSIAAGRPLPEAMHEEGPEDVLAGAANLRRHIEIVRSFGVPVVVAINAFADDHPSELDAIAQVARDEGARVAVSTHVADGGAGAEQLAVEVEAACADGPADLKRSYDLAEPLETKLERVATQVYGAAGISLSPAARRELDHYTALGYADLPVVIAKTHLSVSHDPTLRGDPRGFTVPIREVRLAAGAGYVYALAGEMRTMPGLGRHPAAEQIDIDADGNVVGLF